MDLFIPASELAALAKTGKIDRKRVLDAIQQVANAHPQRMSFVTEMVGMTGVWRLRKGDWRVIYEIGNGALTVRTIAQRKDAYG